MLLKFGWEAKLLPCANSKSHVLQAEVAKSLYFYVILFFKQTATYQCERPDVAKLIYTQRLVCLQIYLLTVSSLVGSLF